MIDISMRRRADHYELRVVGAVTGAHAAATLADAVALMPFDWPALVDVRQVHGLDDEAGRALREAVADRAAQGSVLMLVA